MQMSEAEQNVKLVQNWVDAINNNDVERELSCWHPDGEYFIMATDTHYKGIGDIRKAGEVSASMISGQPSAGRKQITNLFATDEWACVEYRTDAKVSGPISVKNVEILPKGVSKTVRQQVCIVFHIRDGKFELGREYFDTSGMARQLGLNSSDLASFYSSMADQLTS